MTKYYLDITDGADYCRQCLTQISDGELCYTRTNIDSDIDYVCSECAYNEVRSGIAEWSE